MNTNLASKPNTPQNVVPTMRPRLPWQPAFRALRPEIVEGFIMPGFAGRYYMWPEEFTLLEKYVDLTRGDYLEIGSMCGIIAMSFAKKFPQRKFVCVDYFQPGLGTIAGDKEIFLKNLRDLALRNVTLIEGDSRVEVPKLTGKFGIAFIDGNHAYDYVLEDALNCHRLVEPGGYLIFHDYECVQETTQALHDFLKQTDCRLVETASSAAAVWKPSDAINVHKPHVQVELEQMEQRIRDLENDLDWAVEALRDQEAETLARQARVVELERVLRSVENSAAWRLVNPWRQLRDRVMPEGGRLRKLYNVLLRPLRG